MKVRSELAPVLGVLLSKCRDKSSEEKAREEIADSPSGRPHRRSSPRRQECSAFENVSRTSAGLRSWLTVVALFAVEELVA